MSEGAFAWFVGVDWSSESTRYVFLISKGLSRESGAFRTVVQVLLSWATGSC